MRQFYSFYLGFTLIKLFLIFAKISLTRSLTEDFKSWLRQSEIYSDWAEKFAREDLIGYGSFGGRISANQQLTHHPVVFIHGNSDSALGDQGFNDRMARKLLGEGRTGWRAVIDFFLTKGFIEAELYATTWGSNDIRQIVYQSHSCEHVMHLRKFVEAVIEYTNSTKISVISHSHGVTLGRKVIQGGFLKEHGGPGCEIGHLLTNSVKTFIGIAGGNRGLMSCYNFRMFIMPFCNNVNGMFPGFVLPSCHKMNGLLSAYCPHSNCMGNMAGLSEFLIDLNTRPKSEGQNICSIWSRGDNVIKKHGDKNLVFGYPTSRIPGQDGEKVYDALDHIESKDKTAKIQYEMVINNSCHVL